MNVTLSGAERLAMLRLVIESKQAEYTECLRRIDEDLDARRRADEDRAWGGYARRNNGRGRGR